MKLEKISIDGKKSEIEALDSIFSSKINNTVVSSVLYKTNANYKGRRAKTKQKNEIIGSTSKIYAQKGTGNARHASRKAPIFVGGGVAHGPKGQNNHKIRKLNKSEKVASIKSLLTEKNVLNPRIERTLEITYGLRNFIGNAAKYSNSLVDISLESNNKITEVKVCDDGPGFSEDILNVLGEPYIRSKNKIISSKSGLGLGTFIGKTLLERMKASVKFDKCPKTNGAMVTIKWQTKDLLNI